MVHPQEQGTPKLTGMEPQGLWFVTSGRWLVYGAVGGEEQDVDLGRSYSLGVFFSLRTALPPSALTFL